LLVFYHPRMAVIFIQEWFGLSTTLFSAAVCRQYRVNGQPEHRVNRYLLRHFEAVVYVCEVR